MDIESFRWLMSTIAQTLGAITALIVTVYFILANKNIGEYESLEEEHKHYCMNNSAYKTICTNNNINTLSDIRSVIAADDNIRIILNELYPDMYNIYREYLLIYKSAKNLNWLKTPVISGFITIALSIISLLFSHYIAYKKNEMLLIFIVVIVTIKAMFTLCMYCVYIIRALNIKVP